MRLHDPPMKRWVLLGLLWFGTNSSLQAKSETVYFDTVDGAHIEATLSGAGTHGVVLAHGGQFTKSSWNKQVRILNDAGFRTLAINFRGRGRSKVAPDDPRPSRGAGLYPVGLSPHYQDVLAAVVFLREQGCSEISVIGGSIGGGATSVAAAMAPTGLIDRVVLLAATPINKIEAVKGSKLFVTTEGDNLDVITAQYEQATEPKKLVVLEGRAHAQHIFKTAQAEPLMAAILAFLRTSI